MKNFLFIPLFLIILIFSYFAIKRLNFNVNPVLNRSYNEINNSVIKNTNNSGDAEKRSDFEDLPSQSTNTSDTTETNPVINTDFILPKLVWQTYKNTKLNLQFKYPSNYYEVWESPSEENTCIFMGAHKNWVPSISICYIYNKDTIASYLDIYKDPIKFKNSSDYVGTITKTTFKENNALLMKNEYLQQTPYDTMEIFINKDGALDHLVKITYQKEDLENYLAVNDLEWDAYEIDEYKIEYQEVIKVIIDSINL